MRILEAHERECTCPYCHSVLAYVEADVMKNKLNERFLRCAKCGGLIQIWSLGGREDYEKAPSYIR